MYYAKTEEQILLNKLPVNNFLENIIIGTTQWLDPNPSSDSASDSDPENNSDPEGYIWRICSTSLPVIDDMFK